MQSLCRFREEPGKSLNFTIAARDIGRERALRLRVPAEKT